MSTPRRQSVLSPEARARLLRRRAADSFTSAPAAVETISPPSGGDTGGEDLVPPNPGGGVPLGSHPALAGTGAGPPHGPGSAHGGSTKAPAPIKTPYKVELSVLERHRVREQYRGWSTKFLNMLRQCPGPNAVCKNSQRTWETSQLGLGRFPMGI